jgi:hypothetical protein
VNKIRKLKFANFKDIRRHRIENFSPLREQRKGCEVSSDSMDEDHEKELFLRIEDVELNAWQRLTPMNDSTQRSVSLMLGMANSRAMSALELARAGERPPSFMTDEDIENHIALNDEHGVYDTNDEREEGRRGLKYQAAIRLMMINAAI